MSINFLKPDGTMGGGLSFGNGQFGSYGFPGIPNLYNDTRGFEVTPDNQYVQLPDIQPFIDRFKPQIEKFKPEVTALLEKFKISDINNLKTSGASVTPSINPAKQTAIKKLMSKQNASDRLRRNKAKENMMRFYNAQQLTRTTDTAQADTNKLQADLMARLYK